MPIIWPHAAKNALTFLAAVESDSAPVEEEHTATILDHAFVAESENGFMVSRGDEVAWTCTAPGSAAQLEW